MEKLTLLAFLITTISWHKAWAGVQDPQIIENIKKYVWEGEIPQNIRENVSEYC